MTGAPRCIRIAAPVQRPCKSAERPPSADVWIHATDAQRATARRRLEAVERAGALVETGMDRSGAFAAVAAEAGYSVRSLLRWRKRTRDLAPGERLAALIDRPRSGRPKAGQWAAPGADLLWRHWCTDYLREEAPDAQAVHNRLAGIAAARVYALPPVLEFERRTKREIPRAEIVRAREGALVVMDLAPHQTRTVEGLPPLGIVNGDGRRHDVIVDFPSGRQGRPVVWMWQDVRTRRILAWRAGETESADLVHTSLHALIIEHGVPECVLVDLTRAASAKWATGGQPGRKRWRSTAEELPGLLKLLEIRYSATTVDRDAAGRGKGRGRAKPVERAFGDLARQIDSHPAFAGAGTGRSTQDRPETHRMTSVPFSLFLDIAQRCIAEHNARPGRETEAAAGRSFDATWADEISRTVVRRLAPAQAAVLLLAAEDAMIDRAGCLRLKAGRGIGLPANRYHHINLVERAGQRVVARFDPARLHDPAQIFDAEGRWICAAGCLQPEAFDDRAAAGRYNSARQRMRRSAETGLAARRDMDALLSDLGTVPAPAPAPEAGPAAVRLVTNSDIPATSDRPEAGDKSVIALDPRTPAPRKRSAFLRAAVGHYTQREET